MTAGQPEPVTDLAADLQAALADGDRALSDAGDLRASRRCFERAYRLAEQAGAEQAGAEQAGAEQAGAEQAGTGRADAVEAMALAALGLAGLWVSERRTVIGAVLLEARLQHVLSLLDQDSSLALRIRARLAAEADYVRGEHAGILAVLDEARVAADPVALADALSLAHHCLLGPEHVTRRRALAVELIKVSFRTERRSDRLMGLLWQTVDGYSQGDPHAGRLLGELREQLRQRDHPVAGFIVSAMDVMLAIRSGRLDAAESLVGICAANGAAAGDVDCEWWPGAQLVTIRWYQGRLVELLPMLREKVQSPALSAVDNSAVAALAVAAALDGDLHAAASCLAALCGGDLASLPRSSSWLVTMNGIVQTAFMLDDAAVAAQAYDLLRPHGQLPMVGGLGITCFGSAQQALGTASLVTGQLDVAIDHLRAAVQDNLALAHWPAVVSSRQRLTQALLRRGHPGDAAAAQRESVAARSEAAALGLPPPPDPGHVPGSKMSGEMAAECDRVGRMWRLTLGERSVLVEDSIGMLHLAVLIANPRQDIAAADLVTGLSAVGGAGADGGQAQPVLDQVAICGYRSRLKHLDAELGEQEPEDDPDQVTRARAEREWLVAQLTSTVGLGGRVRPFPDEGERARVATGKAIRRALVRIVEADPAIGEHLRQAVHTGARCSYWPG